MGWAYFLETRDGRLDLDPADPYREAVTEDPNNPYAQAMWGYWILWDHCYRIKEAAPHFAAAIARSAKATSCGVFNSPRR